MTTNEKKFYAIAAGIIAVVFVGFAVLTWFQSRGRFEEGELWFAALTFMTGGFSVVLLVWTFYEQRKLTQNESCAYLEVVRGVLLLSPEMGLTYRLYIRNTGNTPARRISADIQLTFVQSGEDGDGLQPYCSSLGLYLEELAAHADRHIQDTDAHLISLPGLDEEMGSAYNRYGVIIDDGESTFRHAIIRFEGTLRYEDVYERKHTIPISQYTHSLSTGLFGTGVESNRNILDPA